MLISRWHGRCSRGWAPLGSMWPVSGHPAPLFPRLSCMHKLQNDRICKVLTSNQLLSFGQKSPKVPIGVRSQRSLWSFRSVASCRCETTGSRAPHAPAFCFSLGRVTSHQAGKPGQEACCCLCPPGGSTRSHPEGCQSTYNSTIRVTLSDLRQQASHCAL